jgi:hypothetical protein
MVTDVCSPVVGTCVASVITMTDSSISFKSNISNASSPHPVAMPSNSQQSKVDEPALRVLPASGPAMIKALSV